MPPVGFVPTIPADERSQTHALERAATGIGRKKMVWILRYTCHVQKLLILSLVVGHAVA
jgi:hypothetical protein